MKYIKIVVAAAFFLVAGTSHAEDDFLQPKEWWHYYGGTIDGGQTSMAIYVAEGGKVTGSYSTMVENGTETQTEFHGLLQDGAFIGTESSESRAVQPAASLVQNIAAIQPAIDPPSQTQKQAAGTNENAASLAGFFYRDKEGFDRFKGHRRIHGQNGLAEMTFQLESGGWGTADRRYGDFHGTDKDVEAYTARVKTAILQGEKQWLAKQLLYPFEELGVSGKKVNIQSESDFIANFETIFHTGFKTKLKTMRTNNLHSSNGGIAIGRGNVWVFSTQSFPNLSGPARFYIKEINT